jgi:hypothetical protein
MDFQITVYRYIGSIWPHSDKAKSKGEVSVLSHKPGMEQFNFIAPNDETAMSYLNYMYKPDDKRELGGIKMLTFCKNAVETPKMWQNTIEACMCVETKTHI